MDGKSLIWRILNVLLLIVFMPVLFCVAVIGNNMDYFGAMKLATRLPGQVLFLIALAGVAFCIFLLWKFNEDNLALFKAGSSRMDIHTMMQNGQGMLSRRANWVVNGVLAFVFFVLYFVNVWIAREIAFHLPWDISVVREVAYEIAHKRPLGYFYYLSIYPNNIPISYILGRLYRKAMEMDGYPYIYDFIWIQVNCILISFAGFFCCLLVKKLTNKLIPVIGVFFLYLVLVGISPWKIAPYTDTYGLVFPVVCIYFYVCYREARYVWSKYLCIVLSIVAGMIGGGVKPNIYIVVIALLGTEFICLLTDFKKRWKFILAELLLVMVLAVGNNAYRNHLISEIGLEYNEELEAGWQHYIYMGLNEGTTGGYNSDDNTMFGEFQTSKSDRNGAEIERAVERIKDRGFFGSIYFYLRKMVMTFNDGVFGWQTEVWIDGEYPAEMAGNTALTQRLRSIFWGNELRYDVGGYNAFCQLVWFFSMICIPGVCLCKDEKREEYGVLTICFLGVFFYQMLFEARARYLFVFLPIILPMAICGIQQYTNCIIYALKKERKKYDGAQRARRQPDT